MPEKYKVFTSAGLTALTTYMKGVKSDLTELVEIVNDALQEIGGAVISLDENKAYVAATMSLTLSAANWVTNTGSDSAAFPYKYVLSVSGVTTDTRVDAVLDAASSKLAGEYGMSAATETAADSIIFRSVKRPALNLTGTIYITQGAEPENNQS